MGGIGQIYKRGRIYWIAYYVNGKKERESSGTSSEQKARKLLQDRLGAIASGKFISPRVEGLMFAGLEEAIVGDYELNGKRSLKRLRGSLKHLRAYFLGWRASKITTASARAYAQARKHEGAANGTINRELAALKRMLKLAEIDGKLSRAPHIPMLDEAPPRQGFFEHDAFLAVLAKLPEVLRGPVEFLYRSGWRLEEMQSLEWRDVDLAASRVRLRAEQSKNERPRLLVLQGALLAVIERAKAERRLDCPFVFHRNGRRIKDFRRWWKKACAAAGVPGLYRHDFRRTTVRNLARAGVPDKIAMDMTGHKTRAVYDRYNITSEADLARAAEALDAYLGGGSRHNMGTIKGGGLQRGRK